MSLKTQRLYYMSRNLRAGLSDVRADIYKDGNVTPVDTGVVLSELDATNSPGLYLLELDVPTINNYGGVGQYVAKINSATRNAPATVKFEVLINDNDDLEVRISQVEAKIDDLLSNQSVMQGDVTSIKSTVEDSNTVLRDGNIGNANLKLMIEQVISAVSSVQNNTRFVAVVPQSMVVPDAGGTFNDYKVEIRLFDMTGNAEDPDSDDIKVVVKNAAGLDRTNLIDGYSGGPVSATKEAVGKYHVTVKIADTSAIEQLNFNFEYSETNDNGEGPVTSIQNHPRTSETVVEAAASGLALQSTLIDVLTDTAEIQPKVATILNMVNDGVSGLPALKSLLDILDGVADSTFDLVNSPEFGVSAIKTILDSKASQVSVDAIDSAIQTDLKGADFDAQTDSLKAVSERVYVGGNAV